MTALSHVSHVKEKIKELILYYKLFKTQEEPVERAVTVIIDPHKKEALLCVFDGTAGYEEGFTIDKETLYKLYQELKKIFE